MIEQLLLKAPARLLAAEPIFFVPCNKLQAPTSRPLAGAKGFLALLDSTSDPYEIS